MSDQDKLRATEGEKVTGAEPVRPAKPAAVLSGFLQKHAQTMHLFSLFFQDGVTDIAQAGTYCVTLAGHRLPVIFLPPLHLGSLSFSEVIFVICKN